ncbi:aspartate-alanine antiporter [Xanthomonas cucurbitae]|nr:aspartate-alanine antiporter [Xanthomonas cucurbitae]WDM80027.1 aspartate-alanine antiporter [Xanthomonas cucurbitae]WDM83721.1 aspartate-alanine antiporter [Xanthomonas cucurbitae]
MAAPYPGCVQRPGSCCRLGTGMLGFHSAVPRRFSMMWLHEVFTRSPEAAIFLTLAIGYAIGRITFGRFQLGGIAGSLLVAVCVSQIGISIDDGVKAIMFALFIYAVGYNSGPQFFSSLNRSSIKEVVLAGFLAVVSLATVLALAKWFQLDKGLAAGLAGGALTQSAIIGIAGDAIARLPLPSDQIAALQANVAIGYAVTYVFGSLGAIIVCANILPRFMKQDLRQSAQQQEECLRGDAPVTGAGMESALPALVGRAYRVDAAAGLRVREIEDGADDALTIERVIRGGDLLDPAENPRLESGDVVVAIGRREKVVDAAERIGPELPAFAGTPLVMRSRQAVFTRQGMNRMTIAQIKAAVDPVMRHGVYVASVMRMGRPLPVLPQTQMMHGDVVTIYGADSDTARAVREAGYPLAGDDKTDFVYMGAGIVVGLLVGLLVADVGGIPLTLGAGGGVLLSGLLFGWLRAKRPIVGALPPAAGQLLQDFGLAAFVVVIGLNSGKQALGAIQQHGIKIFVLGIVVTLLPLLLSMLFGRYVLGYRNVALFAGALSGSRSANPAIGAVLDKTASSVPTVPFAITYALANVFLTLLGPLIVGLV